MEARKVIGIDIGGTKVHLGVVKNGKVLEELKLSTPSQAPKAEILGKVTEGIKQLMDAEVAGIGIGVPGLVDEKNGIVLDVQNIPSWKEVHLKKHLEDYFKKPVYVANDANSFVAGVKIYGKGRDLENFVGVTLGTGIGTGIIIDNKLYTGAYSSAGEFGGIPYLDQTVEDYCSGKFFTKKFGVSGKVLQKRAEGGDAEALDIFNQFGHHLGNALKLMLFALSPEAIFLGGSVCKGYSFFKEAMEESISSFPFKLVKEQLVLECSEIESASILGAAALFKMRSLSGKVGSKMFV
ncbi:ROK family protein [Flammeovirgaceae bacterium 311]|nr:ROK family protein [Flammeovirgaceae bacterium 311]